MHGPGIAGAIAAVAASIADALLDGRPTAALRAEMSELEQRQRREVAAAAAEREARAALYTSGMPHTQGQRITLHGSVGANVS